MEIPTRLPGSKRSPDPSTDASRERESAPGGREPVAIIGMGCRFPRAPDPEALWKVLVGRKDCVGEIPAGRFPRLNDLYDPTPGTPGRVSTRQGGFFETVDGFDPYFFGISPREATFMDPQQRLLLEVGWEAIEDAGLPIEDLSGSRTGVYLGLWTGDYELQMFEANSDIDLYMTTGGGRYAAAGRMSYIFDLQGPSLVVDTACSTSLVTAHLACQSLAAGESDLAVAGGVNLIIEPPITIAYSKAKMLSPDGRCKFGDAKANGYVRSEGCGVIVLKRLADAIRDGDRIYATILGSAVNSDGREGLFVQPQQAGQEKMLREAYRVAGRDPGDVDYLEAHGTGTGVGDPTELGALGAVLGDGRPSDKPCLVGSVKTNIGHTEAAAGAAGLVKAAMCVQRRSVPPTLHFDDPNPEIPWDSLPLRFASQLEPLADDGAPILAGVNSFGISGTNAHIVLEEAPSVASSKPKTDVARRAAYLLPLSARSPDALAAMADKWASFLASADDEALHDICFTAAVRRSHHDYRLNVTGSCAIDLSDKLRGAREDLAQQIHDENDEAGSGGPVFVFAGQGPHWWAMGRRLFETEPVYRRMVERIAELADPLTGWSLLDELNADEQDSRLHETEIAQPTLFAVQIGLDALMRSWGIEPSAIVGHSFGEVAAACSAGALSLEDATRVVISRGRTMQKATGLGKMAAAELTFEEAQTIVAAYKGQVSVAAVNAPGAVTLSGAAGALEEIASELEKSGKFFRMLDVDLAAHSSQVEPAANALHDEVTGITALKPTTTLVSSVTGSFAQEGDYGPEYWRRNVRETVQFATAIKALIDAGHRTFVELGPHPALTYSISQNLSHHGVTGDCVGTLRNDEDECESIMNALGRLYEHGYDVDWAGLYANSGRCVSLPTYPWQHERFWFEPGAGGGAVGRGHPAPAFTDNTNSALGLAIQNADQPGRFVWERGVAAESPGFLRDHRVQDALTFPAAAYVDLALASARDRFGEGSHELSGMTFESALALGDKDQRVLQTALAPTAPGTFSCRFYSRDAVTDDAKDSWTLNAGAEIWLHGSANLDSIGDTSLLPDNVSKRADAVAYDHVAEMRERGLNYGPAFCLVDKAWRGDGWAAAPLSKALGTDWQLGAYRGNPGVWDAGFQLLISLASKNDSAHQDTFLPVAIEKVRRATAVAEADGLWAVATRRSYTDDDLVGDIYFIDGDGKTVAVVEGLRVLRLERSLTGQFRDWMYEIQWQAADIESSSASAAAKRTTPPPVFVQSVAQYMRENVASDDLRSTGQRAAEIEPHLDALCGKFVQQAFAALGWNLQPGDTASTQELAGQLGVIDSQRQMFGRILEFMAEDGLLQRDGDGWQALQVLGDTRAGEAYESLAAGFPEFGAELQFLSNCGNALADVLNGTRDPLELLFSEEPSRALEHLYQDAPMLLGQNELARAAVANIVKEWSGREQIRVFEIGAGTGGTTKRILEALPKDCTDYVFTDLSNFFLDKAKDKYSDYSFLRTGIYDAELEPAEQGFTPGSYDIVVASNVLHATPDLKATVKNAARLLGPNGILLLVEGNQPCRLIDMIFGVTEGWWKFADTELRPSHPLMSTDTWTQALAETGFEESAFVTAIDAFGGALFPQAVIVARKPEAAETQQQQDWLLFADRGGVAEELATSLRRQGAICNLVIPGDAFERAGDGLWHINPEVPEDYARVIADALPAGGDTPCSVAHLWALDDGCESNAVDTIEVRQHRISGTALELAKALAARDGPTKPQVWYVTRGAQAVPHTDGPLAPHQSSLWGLGKVVGLEHPELSCRLVDLDPAEAGDSGLELALTGTTTGNSERWLAVRGEHIFGARFTRLDATAGGADDRLECPEFSAWQLQIPTRGTLDNLVLAPVGRKSPAEGEIEIQVRATGQNFRDVLNALGLYPGDPGALGLECSGVVSAVGVGAGRFKVGDPVVALASGSFASFVTVSAELAAPLPDGVPFEEAAAIPIVFLTAQYALHKLAGIRNGDKVLIHAASGGVGMAATQLALSAGAEVFGTAGSVAKRAVLRDLGVHHVMDSRSLDFADSILEITEGKGVDIVLNSLAGDFIAKSFDVLANDGAFIEIGKQGVWTSEQAHSVKKNCDYHVFDLVKEMTDDPGPIGEELRGLLRLFENRTLQIPPVRTFAREESATAFRTMSQAKHIGKIVISQTQAAAVADRPSTFEFRPDGSYLVTGGLGGLGLLLARWMFDRGARHIVLTGRSAPSTDANSAVDELREMGATVTVVRADISVGEDVSRVLERINESSAPLAGVFHCAGVLDDGVLQQQTWERTWYVLAPKIAGAWHLHEQTRKTPLDVFVLFSSWCSLLGSPGQANHSAANAFLDTLVHERRALGLPALSVDWGAWTEIGAAAVADRSDNLAREGIGSFSPSEGLDALEHLLVNGVTQAGVFPFDFDLWRHVDTLGAKSRLFEHIADEAAAHESSTDAEVSDILAEIEGATSDVQRLDAIKGHLHMQVAQVLRLPTSRIDHGKAFKDLGLDSLTGLELRNRLEASLQLSLPGTLIWNYPSIEKLARFLVDRLVQPVETDAAVSNEDAAADEGSELLESLLDELESISDEDAASQLQPGAGSTGDNE